MVEDEMDILGFGLAGNNNKNLVPKLIRASTGQDGRTSEVLRKAFCIGSHPRVCQVTQGPSKVSL